MRWNFTSIFIIWFFAEFQNETKILITSRISVLVFLVYTNKRYIKVAVNLLGNFILHLYSTYTFEEVFGKVTKAWLSFVQSLLCSSPNFKVISPWIISLILLVTSFQNYFEIEPKKTFIYKGLTHEPISFLVSIGINSWSFYAIRFPFSKNNVLGGNGKDRKCNCQ